MKRISKLKVLPAYRLELEFDDGVSGTMDVSDKVGKGVFALWCDPLVFEQVRIGSSGELVWAEQVDLCPDALYLKVTGKKPEDIFPRYATGPSMPEISRFFGIVLRCFSTITIRRTSTRSIVVTSR